MTNEEFEGYYFEKYRSVVKAIARKLARDDDALFEDLQQEGWLGLLQLDLSKANKNPDSWIRQAIRFSMIDALRASDPNKYSSLDRLLEQHFQIGVDDSDEVVIVRDPTLERNRATERVNSQEAHWKRPEEEDDGD